MSLRSAVRTNARVSDLNQVNDASLSSHSEPVVLHGGYAAADPAVSLSLSSVSPETPQVFYIHYPLELCRRISLELDFFFFYLRFTEDRIELGEVQ